MASKIQGITVEIGGDTTKLGKALAGVNKQAGSLQTELKGVNKLLKMDPSNVTLLQQKQDILNGSIENTTSKLNKLKEVQTQVQEQFDKGEITEEQYRDFQREIETTKQKLSQLTDEAKNFGSVTAQQVAVAGEKMQDMGTKIEGAAQKVKGVSMVAAGVLTGSVVLASNFEDTMAKVSTIADEKAVSLKDLKDEVLELSNETGIAATTIGDNVYDAISAGQKTEDAVGFVRNSTNLARAGYADAGDSLDLLTTIMNAYKLEAGEVGNVSDMLIQTQNKGKTTVGELATSMGKIIPTANSMNVGLEELSAGYAIMTSNGIATAESTTYMNSMLNELGKSNTKVAGILKDETGKSFQQLMEEGYSLGDVLKIIDDNAKASGVGFNDMWSSSEASKAGITLLSGGVAEYNATVAEMVNSSGSTQEAIEKLETPSYKAKKALNELKNTGIELGDTALGALAPLLEGLSQAISSLASWFSNLPEPVKMIIVVILGLTAALFPVLMIVAKVISAVGTIMTFAPQLAGAFGVVKGAIGVLGGAFTKLFAVMMANPIILIIALVAGLVAGLVYAYNHCETFRNIVNVAFEKVKEVVSGVVNGLVVFFTQTIPNGINTMVSFFTKLPGSIWNAIVGAVNKVKQWGSNLVSAAVSAASSLVSGVVNTITSLPGKMLDIGKNIVTGIWNGITGSKDWLLGKISGFAGGVVDGIKGFFGIHSPSVVMQEQVGRYLSEGIASGILNYQNVPIDASDDVKKNILNKLNEPEPNPINVFKSYSASQVQSGAVAQNASVATPIVIELKYKDLSLGRAVISDLKEITKLNGQNPVFNI